MYAGRASPHVTTVLVDVAAHCVTLLAAGRLLVPKRRRQPDTVREVAVYLSSEIIHPGDGKPNKCRTTPVEVLPFAADIAEAAATLVVHRWSAIAARARRGNNRRGVESSQQRV